MVMTPEKIHHSISFLTGEVHALFLAIQVLAKINPNRELLLSEIEQREQAGLANIEPLLVQDAVIEGFQFGMAGVKRILQG